jgi:hypothetical protein
MKHGRFVLVVTTLFVPAAITAVLAACSDDTSVQTSKEAGGPDAQGTETSTDTDAASEGGVDAGEDVIIAPTALAEYVAAHAAIYCTRAAKCCGDEDAGTIDDAKCKTFINNLGFDNTILHAGDVLTDDAGGAAHVVVAPMMANLCLTRVASAPCTITEAQNAVLLDTCRGALNGTLATGGKCSYSIECAQPAYCKLSGDGGAPLTDGGPLTGTCQPLEAVGANCSNVSGSNAASQAATAQEACASRAFGTPPRYCDAYNTDSTVKNDTTTWKCADGQDAGAFCPGAADYCTSRQCDFNLSVCISGAPFVDPSACALFK